MTTTVRKRGRPTAVERAARDERILDAAIAGFVATGFHDITLDAIADAAGVTKRTIYDNVGDKAALLRATAGRVHAYTRTPAADLASACLAVATALFSDRAVGLHRAVIAVAAADPAAARQFYDAGPRAAQHYLAEHLDGDGSRAELLFGALLGEPHRRRLLGIEPEPPLAELRTHVARVLDALGGPAEGPPGSMSSVR